MRKPTRAQIAKVTQDQQFTLALEELFATVEASKPFAVGDLVWSCAATRAGALVADGTAVSRTTYDKLFAVIGTTYGPGDGSTTFNLPNVADVGGVANTAFIIY